MYEILFSGTLSVYSRKAHLKIPYGLPCSVALYNSTKNIAYLVICRYSPSFYRITTIVLGVNNKA
jgi:hypothetical protein